MSDTHELQRVLVLKHLRDNKITSIEALNLYGVFRLADIIFKLRDKGHNIGTVMIKKGAKRFAEYELIKEAK